MSPFNSDAKRLYEYCRARSHLDVHNRIEFHNLLMDLVFSAHGEEPPAPLLIGTRCEIMQRVNDQIKWADENGFLREAEAFIHGLRIEEWPCGDRVLSDEAVILIEYCQQAMRVVPTTWLYFHELLCSLFPPEVYLQDDKHRQFVESPRDIRDKYARRLLEEWRTMEADYPEKSSVEIPPMPLILSGSGASDREKQDRLIQQIEWADRYGAIDIVTKYLTGLSENQWNHGRPGNWDWSYWEHAFDDEPEEK